MKDCLSIILQLTKLGKLYNDRREIILIYGNAVDDSQWGEIIHDLIQTKSKDMSNSVLKEVMKYYKETNVGISVMCKIWDKIENDRIQER